MLQTEKTLIRKCPFCGKALSHGSAVCLFCFFKLGVEDVEDEASNHFESGSLSFSPDGSYRWHFARGKTSLPRAQLKTEPGKFISVIGFVDGHAAQNDFTRALTTDPTYPLETAPEWIWYKPKNP